MGYLDGRTLVHCTSMWSAYAKSPWVFFSLERQKIYISFFPLMKQQCKLPSSSGNNILYATTEWQTISNIFLIVKMRENHFKQQNVFHFSFRIGRSWIQIGENVCWHSIMYVKMLLCPLLSLFLILYICNEFCLNFGERLSTKNGYNNGSNSNGWSRWFDFPSSLHAHVCAKCFIILIRPKRESPLKLRRGKSARVK